MLVIRERNFKLYNLTDGFSITQPSKCKIYQWELWNDTSHNLTVSGPTVWSTFIKINQTDGVMSINHNNNPNVTNNTVFEIYFTARTIGHKVGFLKLSFKLIYPSTNFAPYFESPPQDFSIKVDGNL